MFGQTWNNNTIRKYVIYFGTLFNDVWVQRDNAAGVVQQTMKVPLNYGPKEKFLARLEGNPNLDRNVAITLPRMAFEIINIAYAPERKVATTQLIRNVDPSDPNKQLYQYSPTPFDIEFSLYIMVKNQEDGTRIVEQILPFFTPTFTATLNINPDMGIKYDIPVTLNSIAQEDTYEGDFINRRAIIWTLNFTLKGYLFGPTRSSNVIKEIDLNFKNPAGPVVDANNTNTATASLVKVSPGLDSNGDPVNWYGDVNAEGRPTTVDKNTVQSTDNYGYMIDFYGDP